MNYVGRNYPRPNGCTRIYVNIGRAKVHHALESRLDHIIVIDFDLPLLFAYTLFVLRTYHPPQVNRHRVWLRVPFYWRVKVWLAHTSYPLEVAYAFDIHFHIDFECEKMERRQRYEIPRCNAIKKNKSFLIDFSFRFVFVFFKFLYSIATATEHFGAQRTRTIHTYGKF